MSACASIQTRPGGAPCARVRPASVPIAIEWSPPKTTGTPPSRTAFSTTCESSSHTRSMTPKYFAFASSSQGRLPNRNREVSVIDDRFDPEPFELGMQLRVAHRRRAHVDAAPARPQVHRDADDVDAFGEHLRLVHGHGSFADFGRKTRSAIDAQNSRYRDGDEQSEDAAQFAADQQREQHDERAQLTVLLTMLGASRCPSASKITTKAASTSKALTIPLPSHATVKAGRNARIAPT